MGYGDSRETDDGAIIESSVPISDKPSQYIRFNNISIYKAQVEEVIYSDDPRNVTGQVEYTLTLLSYKANDSYRKVYNAVPLNFLGGINDYSEVIYKPKTQEITRGKEESKAFAENTNGDLVSVMFLEGNEQSPVILGPWYHPRNSNKRAKTNDGHRMKGEYNGIEWEINKDGEFILTSLGGPRDDSGNLTNANNGGIFIKIAKDGNITIEANKIKVGNDAIEPMVLGNQWVSYTNAQLVTKLNTLISAVSTLIGEFSSHTHTYTWTGSPGAGSTAPPTGGSSASPPASATTAGPTQLAKKGVVE